MQDTVPAQEYLVTINEITLKNFMATDHAHKIFPHNSQVPKPEGLTDVHPDRKLSFPTLLLQSIAVPKYSSECQEILQGLSKLRGSFKDLSTSEKRGPHRAAPGAIVYPPGLQCQKGGSCSRHTTLIPH